MRVGRRWFGCWRQVYHSQEQVQGVVKFMRVVGKGNTTGWGFIQSPAFEEDLFFHSYDKLVADKKVWQSGDPVKFRVAEDDKGQLHATELQRIQVVLDEDEEMAIF